MSATPIMREGNPSVMPRRSHVGTSSVRGTTLTEDDDRGCGVRLAVFAVRSDLEPLVAGFPETLQAI